MSLIDYLNHFLSFECIYILYTLDISYIVILYFFCLLLYNFIVKKIPLLPKAHDIFKINRSMFLWYVYNFLFRSLLQVIPNAFKQYRTPLFSIWILILHTIIVFNGHYIVTIQNVFFIISTCTILIFTKRYFYVDIPTSSVNSRQSI